MTITIKTTKKVINYLVPARKIKDKIDKKILSRKSLQLAAFEYAKNLLERRMPQVAIRESYTVTFKHLYS